MNFEKIIFLLAFAFALVFSVGCLQQENEKIKTDKAVEIKEILEFGDKALVDYILYVETFNKTSNRTEELVYDTSLEDIAKSAGIYKPNKKYNPLVVNIEANSNLLAGFVRGLVGMKKGENKTFSLPPEQGYGLYNLSKVFTIPRIYNISRYETVPMYYFRMNNLSYEPGTRLYSKALDSEVINYTNKTVEIKYLPEQNKTFTYNGLPQKVNYFDDENITLEIVAQTGKYQISSPSNQQITATITSINDTHITFDGNNELAGKTLKFTVFVKLIEKKGKIW